MRRLDEWMIGGLVRAYPQPYLAMFNLLKYVGLKGERPSAPRRVLFSRLSPFGEECVFMEKTWKGIKNEGGND